MVGYFSSIQKDYDYNNHYNNFDENNNNDNENDNDGEFGYLPSPSNNNNVYYTKADKVIFIITRYAGLISLLSAICVLIETFTDIRIYRRQKSKPIQKKKQRGSGGSKNSETTQTRTRLLFTNMIAHCLYDTTLVLANLPAPKSMAYPPPGSHGTITTCEIQGFIFYLGGIALLMYDMAISITYVSIVKYSIGETKLHQFEYSWHILTVLFALSFSISALVLNAYNYDFGACGIETYPPLDVVDDDENFEFERGTKQQVDIFDWIYYVLIMIVSLVSIISMTLIYQHTCQIEKRNQRYFSGKLGMTAAGKYSREVGLQGLLYSSTFIISNGPLLIQSIIFDSTGKSNEWILTVVWLLACLHSFFYLLFFMRNRDMKTTYGKILKTILYSWCCCKCCPCRRKNDKSTSSCCQPKTKIKIVSEIEYYDNNGGGSDNDNNNNNNNTTNDENNNQQIHQVVVAAVVAVTPDPQQIETHCKIVEEIKISNCCGPPIPADTYDDHDHDEIQKNDSGDESNRNDGGGGSGDDDDDNDNSMNVGSNATSATATTTTTTTTAKENEKCCSQV